MSEAAASMYPVLRTAADLRLHVAALLEGSGDRVLLRVQPVRSEHGIVEFTGPDFMRQSIALANRFSQAPAGGVVLLLMPHCPELFLLHLGLVLTGRIPAILAWPTNRVDPAKYQRNLLHQLVNLPAAELLTLPHLAGNLGPCLAYPVHACEIPGSEQLESQFAERVHLEPPPPKPAGHIESPDDAVFLQFSGGTTGAQKCVVVTAAMLSAQMRRLGEHVQFTSEDVVVSWLPMYHDMGLIACLWFPLWHGAASLQFAASDWLLEPDLLFRHIERYRGTFCWLPNFAFSYMAGQQERMTGTSRLDTMRGWVNCSEPVRSKSLDSFLAAFAGWGVRPHSLQASYAMAENVFAVTHTTMGEEMATFARRGLQSSNGELSTQFQVADSQYVSSGRALAGMEFRIRRADGAPCEDAEPGGIELKTECLFGGYWGNDGFQTQSLAQDGWYSTGDFGFQVNGELFVIGRTKDIVIVGGNNVFPEDIEAAVNTLPAVYTGRVVAFGVQDAEQGTEALAVVAEMRGEWAKASASALEKEIRSLVLSNIGIAPRYVRAVPERWIVKSTAGKISRRETRVRFESEFLTPPQEAVR
jgi:acyl-CoA synthetase (AMP-forming)/AMP-acid ligase II